MSRWNNRSVQDYAQDVKNNGYTLLQGLFPKEAIDTMTSAFMPLLDVRMKSGAADRGPGRYYMTLPFLPPFAEEHIFANEFLLDVVEGIVGPDCVMCQLAADTPVPGSTFQPVHRDAAPLFPEDAGETPAYQLAVNFPLCDILDATFAPFEIAAGTHKLSVQEQQSMLAAGCLQLQPLLMHRGDVMVRDVRALHRGTPYTHAGLVDVEDVDGNDASSGASGGNGGGGSGGGRVEGRPMVVMGYSRKWLRRPEVGLKVPQSLLQQQHPVPGRIEKGTISNDKMNGYYRGAEATDAVLGAPSSQQAAKESPPPQGLRQGLGVRARRLLRFEDVVPDEQVSLDPVAYCCVDRYDAEALEQTSGHSIALQAQY